MDFNGWVITCAVVVALVVAIKFYTSFYKRFFADILLESMSKDAEPCAPEESSCAVDLESINPIALTRSNPSQDVEFSLLTYTLRDSSEILTMPLHISRRQHEELYNQFLKNESCLRSRRRQSKPTSKASVFGIMPFYSKPK